MILGYFAHLVWDGDWRRAQQSGRECGATGQGNAGKTAAEVSLREARKLHYQIEDLPVFHRKRRPTADAQGRGT